MSSDDTSSMYSVSRSYQRKLKKMETRSMRGSADKRAATIQSPSIRDVGDDVTN